MMPFQFSMPTKIYFGSGCIQTNKAEFSRWGRKALLVTGRHSARVSGALADVEAVLRQAQMEWEVFDQIEENPTVSAVETAGAAARRFQPDVIIAIGGGSPLDAGKAIAVLAVNDMPAAKLFEGCFAVAPLPILAVPLTAGTGSEVTSYSILTDVEQNTKRNFAHTAIYPYAAFLDARYTQSLSRTVTVNSAVDALSHAMEGYLSRRSTPVTDCLALEAMRIFGTVHRDLLAGELDLSCREALLTMSLLAGIVLSQTGTTVVHALGYPLTYFQHIPHGRANGLLLAAYLRFNEPVLPGKVREVLAALNLESISQMSRILRDLLPSGEVITGQDIEAYAAFAAKAANTAFTARQPEPEDLRQLLRDSLLPDAD